MHNNSDNILQLHSIGDSHKYHYVLVHSENTVRLSPDFTVAEKSQNFASASATKLIKDIQGSHRFSVAKFPGFFSHEMTISLTLSKQ